MQKKTELILFLQHDELMKQMELIIMVSIYLNWIGGEKYTYFFNILYHFIEKK